MKEPTQTSENVWTLAQSGAMQTDGVVYANDALMQAMQRDRTLLQVHNVACLPGIVGKSIAMPDAHQGYGFCIGGVAAFDAKAGIISPGGVGYDINCGVRLLATSITKADFMKMREQVAKAVSDVVPAGKGTDSKTKLSPEALKAYLIGGAAHAVAQGFGVQDDLLSCEDGGVIAGADVSQVSPRALARGRAQLGTLGSGNHFLEFQYVEDIFDEARAQAFGLVPGTVCVMIHCGSRGLGHQIASDYIKKMEQEFGFSHLPDRELVCAPLSSPLAQSYVAAMNAAINFAFANRQVIMHRVREVLKDMFPGCTTRLVYDVAHNIAKFEEHVVNGTKQQVCVHRKGATRAFLHQPVLIPGSMGTASYVLCGTNKALELSFGSTAHGAGRVMSRSMAMQTLNAADVTASLAKQGVTITAHSTRGIVEEAPDVYKDIEAVVSVSHDLGIATRVARLKPLAVIKG